MITESFPSKLKWRVSRWAALMVAAFAAATAPAQYVSTLISNGLSNPYGVTVDNNGYVYVSDSGNNRILKYIASTNIVNLAGKDGPGYFGTANGTGTTARFYSPAGIVYAPARNGLVVADQGNNSLRYVSLTGTVTNLAGTPGTAGANNGAALSASFSYPAGVAVGNDGATIYIADEGNNSIRVLTPANTVSNLGVGGYTFKSPAGVAVDSFGNVWVADSQHNQICLVSNGTTTVIAGDGTLGSGDGFPATTAEFNLPSGIMWDAVNNLLVISDTRNNTIRELFLTNESGTIGYVTTTVAGIPGTAGYIDGAPATAEFNHPIGLCPDTNADGYYIADSVNNAIRVLQPVQPPPPPIPVPAPVIGYVTFPLVNGTPSATFNPLNATATIFNNAVDLAIEQNDGTVVTYYTEGPTGSVPLPNANSPEATVYTILDNGVLPSQVPPSVASPQPSLTIYAVSEAPPRASSSIVSAVINFVTSNPIIEANNTENEASAVLTDATVNAQIYYTLDGNVPTNGNADTFGPVTSGTTIAFALVTNVTLTTIAQATNFAASGTVIANFSPTNINADELTFGFASGEGSSQFLTAPGQTFIAPITLSLVPDGETIISMQFNIDLTNYGSAPATPATGFSFQSMVKEPVQLNGMTVLVAIPPALFLGESPTNFGSLLFTNGYLLGVGWLERLGETNLYPTTLQTLITYSQAHDTVFLNTGGKVIVGSYSFQVPNSALAGQTYGIEVGSPSATSDGISTPVLIVAPTNGSTGPGPINAIKTVTVTNNLYYLVGDVAPFYWFNAGDFGDNSLQNNDVTETFQTAVYGFDAPVTNSDYFDAMDSANGTVNGLYSNASIDSVLLGDGTINVDDVYVTYVRSLDPSRKWIYRCDSSTGKQVKIQNSGLSQPFGAAGAVPAAQSTNSSSTPALRYVTVGAGTVNTGGSFVAQVPIQVIEPDIASNSLPITTMMIRLSVEPLDGSPALTSPISFSPNTNLGTAFTTESQANGDFAGAWLNAGGPGVSGAGTLGTVTVTLPNNATSSSSYLVHFSHFSASPNGIGLFIPTINDGLITFSSRTNSSWGDGIPDAWRLINFSTVYNPLSAAAADPDGDGMSNLAEYKAGTNPNDPTSLFKFNPGSSSGGVNLLQWTTIPNKHYSIQRSTNLLSPKWTTFTNGILGNGQPMQCTDTNVSGGSQFYRALVQ